MKTKIKTISPDQNIIEHESGLKTVFVEYGGCDECIYNTTEKCLMLINGGYEIGKNKMLCSGGHFTKLLEA